MKWLFQCCRCKRKLKEKECFAYLFPQDKSTNFIHFCIPCYEELNLAESNALGKE